MLFDIQLAWLVLLLVWGFECRPQADSEPGAHCKDYAGSGYFCVPYFQCDLNNQIVTDGLNLIDPRTEKEDSNQDHNTMVTSRCDKLIQVCCQHPNLESLNMNKSIDSDVIDDVFGSYEDDNDNVDDIFGSYEDDNDNVDDIFGSYEDDNDEGDGIFEDDYVDEIFGEGPMTGTPGQCGKRNNQVSSKSSDLKQSVDDADFGEWPHMCALLKKELVGQEERLVLVYLCGASLLADRVVLTAGHCLNGSKSVDSNLVVRCGEWDTQSKDEELKYEERDVEAIEVHPGFNMGNHHNNFALLFLASSFPASSHISPVCLPKPDVVFDQQNCVSNGWGKDKFGAEGRYSTILKEVVVPLVSNEQCQNLLRENTRLGSFFELDNSFICAGGRKGIDTCKGDGGSPLTCKHPSGPWFQAGIVSWGIGCGETDTPAVYANVAKAACWIDKMVKCYFKQSDSYFGFGQDCGVTEECPDTIDTLESEIFA